MLVAGVHVGFRPHLGDPVKVVDVDMDKDSEEPGENLLHHREEVLGEGSTWEGRQSHEKLHRSRNGFLRNKISSS